MSLSHYYYPINRKGTQHSGGEWWKLWTIRQSLNMWFSKSKPLNQWIRDFLHQNLGIIEYVIFWIITIESFNRDFMNQNHWIFKYVLFSESEPFNHSLNMWFSGSEPLNMWFYESIPLNHSMCGFLNQNHWIFDYVVVELNWAFPCVIS